MKAGRTLKYNGKVYLTTLNLVQIFGGKASCLGCDIGNKPAIKYCPLEPDNYEFLCGNLHAPKDEQVIFILKEKV